MISQWNPKDLKSGDGILQHKVRNTSPYFFEIVHHKSQAIDFHNKDETSRCWNSKSFSLVLLWQHQKFTDLMKWAVAACDDDICSIHALVYTLTQWWWHNSIILMPNTWYTPCARCSITNTRCFIAEKIECGTASFFVENRQSSKAGKWAMMMMPVLLLWSVQFTVYTKPSHVKSAKSLNEVTAGEFTLLS